MSKEEYRWYRDHHICVRCHREEAVPGRVMCPDCMAWSRKYDAKRRAKNRETINRNYMKRIHRRKEQGDLLSLQQSCSAGENDVRQMRKERPRTEERKKDCGRMHASMGKKGARYLPEMQREGCPRPWILREAFGRISRVYKKGQSCGNGKPEDTGNKKMDE